METLSYVEINSIRNGLKAGLRMDGRLLNQRRNIKIILDRVNGTSVAEISLGDTKVSAVTTCEVLPPHPDRPYEGMFKLNILYCPMGCKEFVKTNKDDDSMLMSRLIEKCLKDSNSIDLEALCIIPGVRVFSIRCDVSVLDNVGNICDACFLAILSSLRHFRRPDVSIVDGNIIVNSIDEKEPIPLTIHHTPLSITYGLLNNNQIAIMDPNDREEKVVEDSITFILNSQGELCGIHKDGGNGISIDMIMKLASESSEEIKLISQQLREQLEIADKVAKDEVIDRNRPVMLNSE